MRIYLNNKMAFDTRNRLIEIVDQLLNAHVRGVPDITQTTVFKDEISHFNT